MTKTLSPCVRFYVSSFILGLGLFNFYGVLAAQKSADSKSSSERNSRVELVLNSQVNPCVISHTSRVSDEMVSSVRDGLKEKWRTRCYIAENRVEDPLILNDEGSSDPNSVFGLWLSRSIDGRELIVRGVDFKTHLQFGMAKASVHNLTNDSVIEAFGRLSSEVMSQFQFQAKSKGRDFVIWSYKTSEDERVEADRPVKFYLAANFSRHPLLPVMMEATSSGEPLGSGILLANSMHIVSNSKEVERALDDGKTLWLKLYE